MKNLKNILRLKSINNIYENRINLDYIFIFIYKYKIENSQIQIKGRINSNINENYKSIKEKVEDLNAIIKRPYQKDIYKDAFKLRDKIYEDLLEPDIVMLNSNPLINISNNIYSLNNQYYILFQSTL